MEQAHTQQLTCSVCGKSFSARNPAMQYCSQQCAQRPLSTMRPGQRTSNQGPAGSGQRPPMPESTRPVAGQPTPSAPQGGTPGVPPGGNLSGGGGSGYSGQGPQPTNLGGSDGPVRLLPADGYLREGYFDADGYVRASLIEIVAAPGSPRRASDSMVERAVAALGRDRVNDRDTGIAYSQLYRFYKMARAVDERLRQGEPFAAVQGELAQLRARAAVVVGRKVAPPALKDFIDTNVELAHASGEAVRKGFIAHFEAVLCYYKFYFAGK